MISGAMHRLRGRFRYFFSLYGFRKHPLLTIYRAFAWRFHCLLGIPARVGVARWGNGALLLPPEWKGAGATLFYVVREYYDPELTYLDKFVKPGETFVDAGANCGVYTLAAAGITGKQGRVLSFEPGREVFAALQRSVSSNDWPQVKVFEFGLSNEEATVQLYAHPHGASSFSLGKTEGMEAASSIRVRKLDDVLDEEQVERVDCIKMDVEGAEEMIMQGAVRLFERCKPRVIFEINTRAIAALGLKTDGVWRFLEARGYKFYTIDEKGKMEEVTTPPDGGNLVALPVMK